MNSINFYCFVSNCVLTLGFDKLLSVSIAENMLIALAVNLEGLAVKKWITINIIFLIYIPLNVSYVLILVSYQYFTLTQRLVAIFATIVSSVFVFLILYLYTGIRDINQQIGLLITRYCLQLTVSDNKS